MSNVGSERRVVVTGLGCASPLGLDADAVWKNILAGKCGVGRVGAFDISAYDCQIAAEVHGFDPVPAFPTPKEVRRSDRFTHFGVYAGWGALKDSGLDLEAENRDDIGVYIGSGIGGLHTTEEQHKILLAKGPGRVSPFMIPMLILNMSSGLFALYNNLRGPNFATCSACATSNHAIGEAWWAIKRGDASVMFAGGTEATIVPLGMSGFAAMKAMSTRNDDPQHASRPFDRDRDGFVMGEGAAVLVLEELEHARKRGARIYCEIMGYGNTCDANHMTSPDPEGAGAARAIQMGLKHARMRPEEIDYVNATPPARRSATCARPRPSSGSSVTMPGSWRSVPPRVPPDTCWVPPGASSRSSAARPSRRRSRRRPSTSRIPTRPATSTMCRTRRGRCGSTPS